MEAENLLEECIHSCIFIHDDSGPDELYEQYSLNPLLLGVKVCVVDTTKGFGERYLEYMNGFGVLPQVMVEPRRSGEFVLGNLLADAKALSVLKYHASEQGLADISCFFSHPEFERLAKALSSDGNPFAVHPGRGPFVLTNDKMSVRQMALEIGIPVVDGVIADTTADITDFMRRYDPHTTFIMKQPSMTAGKGNTIVRGDEIERIRAYARFPAIVEHFEDVLCPLTANWVLWKGRYEHVFTMPQIVEHASYKGNYFPSPVLDKAMPEIMDYSARFTERLSDFTGVLGYDFIKTKNGVYLTEINGRWCSTTYPFYFLDKIGIGHDGLFVRTYSIRHVCRDLSEFLDTPGFVPLSVRERRGMFLFNPLYDFREQKVTQFTYLCVGRTAEELDDMVKVLHGLFGHAVREKT